MTHPLAETIREKYESLNSFMDERTRRLWAEAKAIGRGGVARLTEATGLSHTTIRLGLAELKAPPSTDASKPPTRRIRMPGGGRRSLVDHNPALLRALEALVEPTTRGDPQSPLRWTCKSAAKLTAELNAQGHVVSPRTVYTLLRRLGYSLQSLRKNREGAQHSDRNAQFEHINAQAASFQGADQPVVSVDTKKKELVGDYKNGGREWQPKRQPEQVRIHDFPDPKKGKAIPYGVYDVAANRGWVSVGIDHDTAEFAVATLRRWWDQMGRARYPKAKRLLITADGGGSNGSRSRLWKWKLQEWADETGLEMTVSHFPPETSKWNKFEHRLFCYITQNWRGRPLVDLECIVNLIGGTTTEGGLEVRADLDAAHYPLGREVKDEEMSALSITPNDFHGECNYTIKPRPGKR